MPDSLAPQWWSPVMPVSFFLSSIAAGTALVVLIDMWIAKGWRRPLEITRLASVGQITFWSLLVYLVFRLGDMAIRNQFAGAFTGRLGVAFAAEILLGGVLPLVLLSRRSLRQRADVLGVASFLAVAGVAYNRMNVVLFAMTFRGRMPWVAPEGYAPSIVEWGDVDRPDRRDDFPLRPGGPSDAGALQGRSPPRHIEPMTPDLWLTRMRISGRSPISPRRSIARRPALRSSTPASPTGTTTVQIFSPACRCCRAPMPAWISSRAAGWRRRLSTAGLRTRRRHGWRPRSARSTRNCDATAERFAPHRRLSAGRRYASRRRPRVAAISRVDRDGAVPPSGGERVRRLARPGSMASAVLPDVRIPARDGAAGRRRSRAHAPAVVRLLRHALAVQANRLPVL